MYRNRLAVVCVVILLSLLGCIGNVVVDRLSAVEPKGFALFYNVNRFWNQIPVYEIVGGKKNELGRVPSGSGILDVSSACLLVAATPGIHTFVVELGTARENVAINIANGMTTPVGINAPPTKVSISPWGSRNYEFKMSFIVDPAFTTTNTDLSKISVNTKARTIHDAVRYGDINRVRELLIADPSCINRKDSMNMTPLHAAIFRTGISDIACLLIEQGADLKAKDGSGRDTLHIACAEKDATVVDALLRRGADVKAKDAEGNTPLHLASEPKMVELIVGHGAAVNAQNNRSQTPLHIACTDKDATIVEALLRRGADVKAKDAEGNTPLHLGSEPKMVELLVGHGADVNARANERQTPLHLAALHGSPTKVEALIALGADVNAVATNGLTPLHAASIITKEGIDEFIISKEIIFGKFNIKELGEPALKRFRTRAIPLSMIDHEKVAGILISKGAKVNVLDSFGRTSLDVAVQNDLMGVAELLRQHGGIIHQKPANKAVPGAPDINTPAERKRQP